MSRSKNDCLEHQKGPRYWCYRETGQGDLITLSGTSAVPTDTSEGNPEVIVCEVLKC